MVSPRRRRKETDVPESRRSGEKGALDEIPGPAAGGTLQAIKPKKVPPNELKASHTDR
jgi:hypothetical protein